MANVTVGSTFKHRKYGRVTILAYEPTDRGGLVLINAGDSPFDAFWVRAPRKRTRAKKQLAMAAAA